MFSHICQIFGTREVFLRCSGGLFLPLARSQGTPSPRVEINPVSSAINATFLGILPYPEAPYSFFRKPNSKKPAIKGKAMARESQAIEDATSGCPIDARTCRRTRLTTPIPPTRYKSIL